MFCSFCFIRSMILRLGSCVRSHGADPLKFGERDTEREQYHPPAFNAESDMVAMAF